MAGSKSKLNPERDIHTKEPPPSVGESAAVFDDDSMFNSADRQAAVLASEGAGKSGRQKKMKTAPGKAERRKTG